MRKWQAVITNLFSYCLSENRLTYWKDVSYSSSWGTPLNRPRTWKNCWYMSDNSNAKTKTTLRGLQNCWPLNCQAPVLLRFDAVIAEMIWATNILMHFSIGKVGRVPSTRRVSPAWIKGGCLLFRIVQQLTARFRQHIIALYSHQQPWNSP